MHVHEYAEAWCNDGKGKETEMKTQWNGNENWDWMKLIAGIQWSGLLTGLRAND